MISTVMFRARNTKSDYTWTEHVSVNDFSMAANWPSETCYSQIQHNFMGGND